MSILSNYLESVFTDCVRSEVDLSADQREAIKFLWENPFSALFLDVGMGKTAITLNIVDRLLVEGYKDKVLIIAPIRVATRVWPQEPKLWTNLAYMNMTVLRIDDDSLRLKGFHGKARTAEKTRLWLQLLDSNRQIHVVNQEAVMKLVSACAARGKWPYTVVIFDESSRLRDHKSVVFKALKKVRSRVTRFHQLTATPASQSYGHLFSQIYLLDGGKRFGKGVTAFRERYFVYNQYARTWKIREGAAEEMERLISDICLVQRRKRDFRVNVRSIRLPAKVMEDYRQFERDLVMELPDDKVIDAVNGAVLCSKLLQYASGAIYDEKRVVHEIHNEKIEELKSLVEETLDEPILVAYWFRHSLERLKKSFPQAAVMDREGKMEKSWNERKHKLLLAHPQSVGHGLNMQRGGHHLAIFDLFYSAELMSQLVGRLDRPGQTHTVVVHLLSIVGSIDEIVSSKLQHLQSAEDEMFSRLTALRRNLKQ